MRLRTSFLVSERIAASQTIVDKTERNQATDDATKAIIAELAAEFEGREKEIKAAVRSLTKKLVRKRIVEDGVRIDGRGPADLRTVTSEVGVLSTAHGSGLFQRGETQVLSVLTLGMPKMDQLLDNLGDKPKKRYMHHYNMPPHANGETGRVGSPKRREIGHGLLAERALLPVVPSLEEWAYTLRVVSEVLSVATLGMPRMDQMLDTLAPEDKKRYMHHYNMPPHANGEVGRVGSPKRREIGHGLLAERALLPVVPSKEDFPYTLRIVSEVLASNGSTSMGSVCGSSLALMDAGVPIKAPVAGIAMGLVYAEGKYTTLTDILGAEDAFGDMDFKVAGTADFVTALQLDTKIDGLPADVLAQALQQAYEARMQILDKMTAVMPEARSDMSDFAPRITTIKINPEKIREIIGKGGSMIRKIQEETSTEINVEDDGTVEIAAVSGENARKAIDWINSLTREVEVGSLYMGKVTRIMGFGAFVEILPGKEGLVRIGELADYHVPTVEDVVAVGDEIMVVVLEVDRQGRINLSRKAAMQRHLAKDPV